ncbi:MAG TPA: hypothetical protein VE890_01655, partial [Thermoguttaceae bacterium]|nr:hypothetical protein [Thermoguttaceae bacterium]
DARKNGLWGAFMAGGCGTEWYFGYKDRRTNKACAFSDLTCEDWRSRDLFWDQAKIAIDFFSHNEIPFWNMLPTVTKSGDWALAGDGYVVVFVRSGGTTALDLPDAEFTVSPMNPKTGVRGRSGTLVGKVDTQLRAATDDDVVFLLKTDEKDVEFDLGGAKAP